ncbi:uncharacterized protein LOC114275053 [Camellia sinensis]|uniref:uncharacterized protein LOC114275053 n=1 Tax=Camellia sinensis TaxID=4442 RepID=UPI001035CF4B|nr:uncharacterized protein LOC114275053 [Camellia sinensis]
MHSPKDLKDAGVTNTESKFRRLYLCWGLLKKAFMNAFRPVIGVDGYHLKGSHGGILLSTVGIDANNCIFPFAYAIVEKEKKKPWLWFLELLGHDLNFVNSHCYTFMSDKQKGLIDAVAELFPNASHKFCVRHLYNNFKGEHKGLVLKDLLWKAARATTVPVFTRVMAEIKEVDCKAYDWLVERPPIHWSRSNFNTFPKCDLLLNNLCRWIPKWNGSEKFEVIGPYGEQYKLDLQAWTCGCRKWDLLGIPCAHVVAATNFLGQEPEKRVHQYYKVETYLKIYDNMLTPINGREMWPRTEYAKLLPPDVKKRAKRPKQNKRKETEAPIQGTKLGRQGTKMTCNNCGKVKRRVIQGSQSTPSPMSSTSTPKEGQMMWRGKLVYNANGIKSASTGQKEEAPT